ncbi:putative latent-transforming growth factor beta-binding protein 2-like isoform X2, partial [Apostichopus japonicus]
INECETDPGVCRGSSVCVNSVGGYFCNCSAGMVYNEDEGICEEPVIEVTERRHCYHSMDNGCSLILGHNVTKQECCCSVGGAWGKGCDSISVCPEFYTSGYREVCPLGRGRTEIVMSTLPEVTGVDVNPPQEQSEQQPIQPEKQRLYLMSSTSVGSSRPFAVMQPAQVRTLTTVVTVPLVTDLMISRYCVKQVSKPSQASIANGITFQVVDPCYVYPDICGNASCSGDEYGHQCSCPYGLVFDEDIPGCIAVNPCNADPYICGNGTCEPSGNFHGYDCYCPLGFDYDAMEKICRAMDYCQGKRSICGNGTCVNGLTSHRCECPDGYEYSERYRSCFDTNECDEEGVCGNGICTTELVLHCHCPTGYHYDINECVTILGSAVPALLVKTQKEFYLRCVVGTLQQLIHQCQDVNECESTPDMCGSRGTCVNTPGSVSCDCYQGYRFDEERFDCLDIDECVELENTCSGVGRCINFPGGAFCRCNAGYQFNRANFSCDDTDECEVMVNVCGSTSTCSNTVGSFNCECPDGFAFNKVNRRCQDIDECRTRSDICGSNGRCVNSEGNFTCICDKGFKLNEETTLCEDVDECEEIENICSGKGNCINVNGGVVCNCERGYKFNSDSLGCEDINECEVLQYCPTFSECVNFIGGASCQCIDGFVTNEFTGFCEGNCLKAKLTILNPIRLHKYLVLLFIQMLTSVKKDSISAPPTVPAGMSSVAFVCLRSRIPFQQHTISCEDVNECQLESTLCGIHGECVNTGGAVRCDCDEGYQFNEDFFRCEDINECEMAVDVCSSNGDCINVEGGVECSCHGGYYFNETTGTCEDVDECLTGQIMCSDRGSCENTNGSFVCNCHVGYRFSQTLATCEDIDECREQSLLCGAAICDNYNGSYNCLCPIGMTFNPDRMLCEDLDECDYYVNICGDPSAICRNIVGSFQCLCQEGFIYSSEGVCEDKNECQIFTSICGNGTCVNSEGSYHCVCHDGFRLHLLSGLCIPEELPQSVPRFDESKQPLRSYASSPVRLNPTSVVMGPAWTRRAAIIVPASGRRVLGSARFLHRHFSMSHPCTHSLYFSSMMFHVAVSLRPHRQCSILVDIDECVRYPGKCGAGICENTPGLYRCKCAEGYTFRRKSLRCAAFDTCSRNPGVCGNGTCSFQGTRLECLCPSGYEFDLTVRQCLDIDECHGMGEVCEMGTCINQKGSFLCQCQEPLVLDSSGRRCIEIISSEDDREGGGDLSLVDMLIDTCWGRASPSTNVCTNPIAERVSYRQCCCGGVGIYNTLSSWFHKFTPWPTTTRSSFTTGQSNAEVKIVDHPTQLCHLRRQIIENDNKILTDCQPRILLSLHPPPSSLPLFSSSDICVSLTQTN